MKTKETVSRRKPATKKKTGARKTSAMKKAAPKAVEAKRVEQKTALQMETMQAKVAPAEAVLIMEILPSTEKSLALWYVKLRKVIGVLGTVLPFVVSLGALIIFGEPQQSSISAYYYTHMRDVFVGTLFAIGFFLYSYEYGRPDGIAAKVTFVAALGVALFPTDAGKVSTWIGTLHLVFAAAFFLTLSYFCLFLFVRTNKNGVPPMTPRKKQRNILYRICGGVMIACILLMGIYHLAHGEDTPLANLNPVFWLEALAIVAFGISWLAKGEAILKDEE